MFMIIKLFYLLYQFVYCIRTLIDTRNNVAQHQQLQHFLLEIYWLLKVGSQTEHVRFSRTEQNCSHGGSPLSDWRRQYMWMPSRICIRRTANGPADYAYGVHTLLPFSYTLFVRDIPVGAPLHRPTQCIIGPVIYRKQGHIYMYNLYLYNVPLSMRACCCRLSSSLLTAACTIT